MNPFSNGKPVIFVSTANVRRPYIKDSVAELVGAGFRNIELSGGTQFYQNYKKDLLELKSQHGLLYRVHNYFPPPEKSFVLNLASTDPNILEMSQKLIREAVDLSVELGSSQYGFHAGFRISPATEELGQSIRSRNVQPYEQSLERFIGEYKKAETYAKNKGIELFIENNVVSARNFENFGGVNPFLLTHQKEYHEIKNLHPFRLLLDVAHLKVSCRTLGLNFESELSALAAQSDYLHLSDNDGLSDSNLEITEESALYTALSRINFKNKSITLEIGDGIESGLRSYARIEKLIAAAY
jgi:sugar phosphate isomerase/epimerase